MVKKIIHVRAFLWNRFSKIRNQFEASYDMTLQNLIKKLFCNLLIYMGIFCIIFIWFELHFFSKQSDSNKKRDSKTIDNKVIFQGVGMRFVTSSHTSKILLENFSLLIYWSALEIVFESSYIQIFTEKERRKYLNFIKENWQ